MNLILRWQKLPSCLSTSKKTLRVFPWLFPSIEHSFPYMSNISHTYFPSYLAMIYHLSFHFFLVKSQMSYMFEICAILISIFTFHPRSIFTVHIINMIRSIFTVHHCHFSSNFTKWGWVKTIFFSYDYLFGGENHPFPSYLEIPA